MKIAVCIHLYHGKMWDEIVSYLRNLKVEYDLYVNLPIKNELDGNILPVDFNWVEYLDLNPDLRPRKVKTEQLTIRHYLKFGIKENRRYTTNKPVVEKIKAFNPNAVIINSPNKGVDIGGFLYTYKHINPSTDLVLKIHTKTGLGSTTNFSESVKRKGLNQAKKHGHNWFRILMDGVLETEEKTKKIINEFKNNLNCGMVGNYLVNNLSPNLNEIKRLNKIFGITNFDEKNYFVGGTIFWVDNKILRKYLTEHNINMILELLPYEYVIEPSPNHAMERLFGIFVYQENKKIISM